MLPRFLFPFRYKIIGWIITLPLLIFGISSMLFEFEIDFFTVKLPFKYFLADNFLNKDETVLQLGDEFIIVGLIIGLLLIAFSKERIEDEYVSQVRLESLQWAIYVNFGFLIVATLFVYGGDYFTILLYNMFTPLLIFIIRFYYVLYLKKS